MPILIMGFIALAVFLVMGLMLFYAAYAEGRANHPKPARKGSKSSPELKTHAPVA